MYGWGLPGISPDTQDTPEENPRFLPGGCFGDCAASSTPTGVPPKDRLLTVSYTEKL